jgi:uncharacterized protein with PQ loop repeat
MDLKNSFFSLLDEIKKSVEEKNMSEELHSSFVVFVYKLYMALLHYVITTIYNVHYFVQTYLPLPKINSI